MLISDYLSKVQLLILAQVRERCRREWTMFQDRMATAEMAYYKAMGMDPPNSTTN